MKEGALISSLGRAENPPWSGATVAGVGGGMRREAAKQPARETPPLRPLCHSKRNSKNVGEEGTAEGSCECCFPRLKALSICGKQREKVRSKPVSAAYELYVPVCSLSPVRLCDPMDCSTSGPLCPWDSLGKNTGVGCHFIFQEIFPHPGVEPVSPTSLELQVDSLPLSHQGNWVKYLHSKHLTFLDYKMG